MSTDQGVQREDGGSSGQDDWEKGSVGFSEKDSSEAEKSKASEAVGAG